MSQTMPVERKMDFSLVLKTSPMFDDLVIDEQASMGIREVTIS